MKGSETLVKSIHSEVWIVFVRMRLNTVTDHFQHALTINNFNKSMLKK